MKEYTPEEFRAILLEYLGARPMEDPELGVVWDDDVSNAKHTMARCLGRGDGYAIYQNADLSHPEIGRYKFMSFGSAAAIWEPHMGPVPPQMPDLGGDINWRYTLQGTYRGTMIEVRNHG